MQSLHANRAHLFKILSEGDRMAVEGMSVNSRSERRISELVANAIRDQDTKFESDLHGIDTNDTGDWKEELEEIAHVGPQVPDALARKKCVHPKCNKDSIQALHFCQDHTESLNETIQSTLVAGMSDFEASDLKSDDREFIESCFDIVRHCGLRTEALTKNAAHPLRRMFEDTESTHVPLNRKLLEAVAAKVLQVEEIVKSSNNSWWKWIWNAILKLISMMMVGIYAAISKYLIRLILKFVASVLFNASTMLVLPFVILFGACVGIYVWDKTGSVFLGMVVGGGVTGAILGGIGGFGLEAVLLVGGVAVSPAMPFVAVGVGILGGAGFLAGLYGIGYGVSKLLGPKEEEAFKQDVDKLTQLLSE